MLNSNKWAQGFLVFAAFVPPVFAQSEVTVTEELVVTASLKERDAALSPAFISVISADDIEKAPINSLADLLRDSVGINNKTDSSGRDEIQIRGMKGRYTLVMVNGKRVSSSGAYWRGGDFDFSAIPLSSIERVEIVRGPMAALYGSDAMGGVVNIITKKPTYDWAASVNLEYRGVEGGDQGGQQRVSVATSGAVTDAVGFSGSVEFSDREPWYRNNADDPDEVPGLEEKKTSSIVTTTSFKISEEQSVDLDVTYMDDERPYGLYSRNSYREQALERYTFGLTHRANWDGVSTVAYLQQESSQVDDFNSSYNTHKQRRVEETNNYAKFYAVGEWNAHAWVAGVDIREQIIEDPVSYLDTGRLETTTFALFAQDEISLNDRLNLTLGGRLDDHDVFGSHFSPKVYLSYQWTPDVVVKGGVSDAYKVPDGNQMSPEFRTVSCGGRCEIVGDPDLKPESSINYELGVEVRKPDWTMSLVLFKNDVDDLISTAVDTSIPVRYWLNVNKATTKGVELDARVDLSSDWEVSFNATLLDIDSSSIDETDNRPELMSNFTLNWHLVDNFSTSLSLNYTGEQTYSGNDLPGYTRVDWANSWYATSALTFRFGIKNLADLDLKDEDPDFLFQELGRNYYLSASYNF
ncbi:MAG: TonB-dependent receptor plug domain-containing protein [Cellvibrio sp.]